MANQPVHVDINEEIRGWESADFGRDVRKYNVSALTKLQDQANAAVDYIVEKGDSVDQSVAKANAAATNADNVRESTEALRQDLQSKLESDYWRGEKGEKGDKGEQGASGVMAPASGMFSLFLDPANGDLYADYPDGETPPAFQYDASSGNLYYLTGDDVT